MVFPLDNVFRQQFIQLAVKVGELRLCQLIPFGLLVGLGGWCRGDGCLPDDFWPFDEEVPYDIIAQLELMLKWADVFRLGIEVGNHVVALGDVLDGVGEPFFAQAIFEGDFAAVFGDEVTDFTDHAAEFILGVLGGDQIHQFVAVHRVMVNPGFTRGKVVGR